jgi:hypothetical protein
MQFYKLLSDDLRHNGFQYKEGLNIDHVPFNPNGSCERGGLYYTSYEWIGSWHRNHWPLIANVTLPPDALVYPEPCGTKWKADRLVLSNIRPIGDFLAEQSEQQLITWLQQDIYGYDLLYHIDNQTRALCEIAVKKNGCNIKWVKPELLTPELKELAKATACESCLTHFVNPR